MGEAGAAGGLHLDRVEAIARSLVEEGRAAGVSVAILEGDVALLSRGYGYADLEDEVPAGPGTIYRIASITKRYTAFAVLQLVEEGRLRLDTRVGEVLGDEYPAGREITVAQLLDHTAGVPNMTSLGDRYWSQIGSRVEPEDLVAIFSTEPLDFAPGTGYAYSNSGYVLLGRIVEVVTGMPYERYLEEHVLAPLGLDDTAYCADIEGDPRLASPYTVADGELRPAHPVDMTQGFSTGGLCATAGDVARFVRAVHTGALRGDLEERMTTPRTLADGTQLSYGFGVGVGSLGGHRLYFHGGTFFGADAEAVYFPDDDLTVVVLSNTDGAGVMKVENRISRLLLGVGPPQARPLEDPGRYTGTYHRGDAEVVVETGGGQLTVRGLWGDDPVPLIHLGDAVFAVGDQLYRVRFEDAAGERRLVLTHYGARILVLVRSAD